MWYKNFNNKSFGGTVFSAVCYFGSQAYYSKAEKPLEHEWFDSTYRGNNAQQNIANSIRYLKLCDDGIGYCFANKDSYDFIFYMDL